MLAAVWLTPQMDRLFQEAASGRRRFLDRLVWALEPGHAREISAYDTAMAGRNRLLAQPGTDPAWLAAAEDGMARHAIAATAARATLVTRLNAAGPADGFPPARLTLIDPIADRLAAEPAPGRGRLAPRHPRAQSPARRGRRVGTDRRTPRRHGPGRRRHRPAGHAGQHRPEQKALLIATILAHATLITQARGTAPLLLLDEPAVHLDEAPPRRPLVRPAPQLDAQIMLTGTDATPFAPLTSPRHLLDHRQRHPSLKPSPAGGRGLGEGWISGAGLCL